jgi:hypothetical protein
MLTAHFCPDAGRDCRDAGSCQFFPAILLRHWYASFWSEWGMADIQKTICQVIKQRSEWPLMAQHRP